jgi:sialidase-1
MESEAIYLHHRRFAMRILLYLGVVLFSSGGEAADAVQRNVLLPPGPGNPRNSEGDFIQLRNDETLFIYSHYYEGSGADDDPAYLASRVSRDGGQTWSQKDVQVVTHEGENTAMKNVMSVSLLRLQSKKIALFYLQKNSLTDCRPFMRVSSNEGKSWSRPTSVIPVEPQGYYVLNNDRVVQLKSGRLVMPVALHNNNSAGSPGFDGYGHVMCYVSDNEGKTWQRSETVLLPPTTEAGKRIQLQEPGVVELKDGKLLMFIRTDGGCQYFSYSSDGGNTWSKPHPSSIKSPLSPALIKRIPKSGDLMLVWNNNYDPEDKGSGKRTPFNIAISKDEGKTWQNMKVLEDNPDGWYCYPAVEFVGDRVLLAHCAGNRPKGTGLAVTQITSFSLDWLYRKGTDEH